MRTWSANRRIAIAAIVCAAACSLPACGNVSGAVPDAATADARLVLTPLITRSWTVNFGVFDEYACTSFVTDSDIYVHSFHFEEALGIHHVILSITDQPNIPIGDYDCSGANYDSKVLYADDGSTPDFALPNGVAMKIPAGSHINLLLHLFNATDSDISGTSGVLIGTMDEADITAQAEQIFVGTRSIAIPADGTPYTAQGGCTATYDYIVFGMWPIMHAAGIHQKVTVLAAGQTTPNILFNLPYVFSAQSFEILTKTSNLIKISIGDQISTTCTYTNTTGAPIGYGESDTGEVCYTGLYRYPADGSDPFACAGG